jgi:transcriptional regulator with XRE-family HTH domain
MIDTQLTQLGKKIARLRIDSNLKQSELAYESGISERTLQRIEAGEVVKSDGLLKVISHLGRLEQILTALDTPSFSPYELAKQKASAKPAKSRVRHSDKDLKKNAPAIKPPANITWPEDQS